MGFALKETFDVDASVDRVWSLLVDPTQVVGCLPGAELTEVIDDRTYAGRVRVKVGPVTAKYGGTVRMEVVDEAERVVKIVGDGKEAAGGGSAKMSMTGTLRTSDSGACSVAVEADVDVTGKMAKFGRGVMEDVARQLFRQFAENMQSELESSKVDDAPPSAEPSTSEGASSSLTPSSDRAESGPAGGAGRAASDSRGEPPDALALVFRSLVARIRALFRR